MKHCFTWIGLICLVMFSVNAGATTPFADDLPDLKLAPNGSGSFPTTLEPSFDLDDYVIDNDESDDVLSWSVSVEAGGPTVNIAAGAQPALHEVDVLANPTVGLYDATFTVTDQDSVTRDQVSTIKYSTFFVTEPKFTADNRLSFKGPNRPRFTYVKLFDGTSADTEHTPSLIPYLDTDLTTDGITAPATLPSFGPLIAHDLSSGEPVEVARGIGVDILGCLDASVLTPSGVVYLTPTGVLSCAVLISIPAVLSGGFNRTGDWDGSVIMVAPAKMLQKYPNWTLPTSLAQVCRFEDIPAGAVLQPGGAGTNVNNTNITSSWRLQGVGALPRGTVRIMTAAQLAADSSGAGNPANQFAGATSGNVLELTQNNAAGTQVMFTNINSFDITPMLPGEIYGISFNIATDIPAAQAANYRSRVVLQWQISTKPDNGIYIGGSLFSSAGSAGLETLTLPTDGKWRQVYSEFVVPALNQNVDGQYNLAPNGGLFNLRVQVTAGTPIFRVFVDNAYIYCKGMSDINVTDANGEAGSLVEVGLANGVTDIGTVYNFQDPATNGTTIDMGFDSGSTLNDNNWRIVGTGKPGFVTLADFTAFGAGTATIDASGRLQTAGCLRAQAPSAAIVQDGRNSGIRFAPRPTSLSGLDNTGAPIAGAPDNSGEGYYGVSFWISSAATSIVGNPECRVYFQEIRPSLNQLINAITLGPSCIPTQADGWVQYSFVGAYPKLDLGEAMSAALIQLDVGTFGNRMTYITPAPYDGTTFQKPGADGKAAIYLDDFVIHKVQNNASYWNYSLFD